MSREAAIAFLKQVGENAELQQKLVQFAKEQGFEFSVDELTEAELRDVAGGKGTSRLLEAATKGKTFSKVEIHGTATYDDTP